MKIFYKVIVSAITTYLFTIGTFALSENDMLQSVLKLQVYTEDAISKNYVLTQIGSAVSLDGKRIITNAHVILDGLGNPTGHYEVCRSKQTESTPECFTTAKLISYDTIADLAILELTTPIPNAKKIVPQSKKSNIGDNIIVYGYPAIGGKSITRTEGKIGGFEDNTYKFDGTIDHGNSGGGAFDNTGKIIGIPFAVTSDNGVIGYVIPYSEVQKFINGKTDNIKKFGENVSTDFKSYIATIQSLTKKSNQIVTKYLNINNLTKNDFYTGSIVESRDGKIFDYRFLHKSNRVLIQATCSKGGVSTQKSGDEELDDALSGHNNNNSVSTLEQIPTSIPGQHIIRSISQMDKNGNENIVFIVFSEDTSDCSILVFANDIKKDLNAYTKALEIAKNARFTNREPFKSYFSSKFFSINPVPDKFSIYEGTSLENTEILPHINTLFGPNFNTNAELEILQINTLNDYMNLYHDEKDVYRSRDYSFDAFLRRFLEPNNKNMREEVLKSKNGKDFILSFIDAEITDSKEYKVLFSYPFKTSDNKLRFYTFEFSYPEKNVEFETKIKELFQNTVLPGNSPFQKTTQPGSR